MQDRFVYTLNFEEKIESCLSKGRLDVYRQIIINPTPSFSDVISVYNANTAISEALVGSIQIMEIAIRNAIHREFRKTFGADWYLNNKVGLDKSGKNTVERLIKKLEKIEIRGHVGVKLYDTPDKLAEKAISELTLGFWTNLFQRKYEDPLWRHTLRKAFPHVGGPLTRSQVAALMNKVRILRNRISHHEQIVRYNLDDFYNDLIGLVSWVSPVTAIWLSHHNRYYEVRNQFREEFALIGK